MNQHALEHIVDSLYCFPVSSKEIVLRLRTAKDDVKKVWVVFESKYVIGDSQQKEEMTKAYTTDLFDFYEVKLTLKDTRLGYVFYIEDESGCYYFSEDRITKSYDFKMGYYNFFQYPYINDADVMECVPWMKTAVFYQIFVDRFCIGNKDKDMSYVNCKWGEVPTPKTFAGGDIRGIIEKLDYIKSIGCNAIYLTPVFASISNHKYDISDYYLVDPQFGTNEDLRELVQTAHKKGMKIVLDAVFNHCSDKMMQFQDVVKKGSASEYFDWFVIDGDKISKERDNYETFASCEYMPKLNTSNPKVQQYLIDIGKHYLKEYDIDGWRLDVSDEISHYFWRKFREEMKATKKDGVIIGENWHDANSNLRGDQYDSIMNYAFTKACLDYFATGKKNAKEMADKLNAVLMRNTDTVNKMMMNLLDSHDTHRFFKEVNRDRRKMKAALCLLFLYPGAPCIFYGTENLIWGGYDPDCRRCMDWDKTDRDGEYKDIYDLLSKLSKIRSHEELADGRCQIYAKDDTLILKNTGENHELILEINDTNTKITWNGGIVIDE